MAISADLLPTSTKAEPRPTLQHSKAPVPRLVALARPAPAPRRRLTLALLAGLSVLAYQCQPATTTEQATERATPPDSLKPETAAVKPLPKFDVESPILRQLALLPPAERSVAAKPMRQYQQLTRRFWLAQYYTDFLLKEAQHGQPNLPAFAQQLATVQSHWRVLGGGLNQYGPFPPTMTEHINRMKEVAHYQQAALSDLQADCASQHPPQPDPATLAAEQQVTKLLAPLQRKPGPITVHLH